MSCMQVVWNSPNTQSNYLHLNHIRTTCVLDLSHTTYDMEGVMSTVQQLIREATCMSYFYSLRAWGIRILFCRNL